MKFHLTANATFEAASPDEARAMVSNHFAAIPIKGMIGTVKIVEVGESSAKDDLDSLTKAQLQERLRHYGVSYETDANKDRLIEILRDVMHPAQ